MNPRASLLAAVFLCMLPFCSAQVYTITDLGPMSPTGINTWAQVVGTLTDHAVLWSLGQGKSLGTLPGGSFSRGLAINDLGEVTGVADGPYTFVGAPYSLPDLQCPAVAQIFSWTRSKGMVALGAVPHEISPLIWPFECQTYMYSTGIALNGNIVGSNRDFDTYIDGFLWTPGSGFTGVGGGYQSRVDAINNLGVMVGEIGQPITNADHATLWKKGSPFSPIDLGTFGGLSKYICSAATSINDQNQVVGWSGHNEVTCSGLFTPNDSMHAFLWTQANGMQDLGALPGDDSSMATKINIFGQVVGISGKSNSAEDEIWDEDGRRTLVGRPFVWSQRKGMRDLNDLIKKNSGWTLGTATDINIWGQVVGVGIFKGQPHGYLLTPKVLFDF